jgi:trehalose-6-phosphate synthase
MPLPEEIKFVVNADPERMGTYMYEPDSETFCHELTISREHHSHLATVIRTLAHEMIHMRRHKTSRWDQHDAVFRRYAHQIAQELGFDPLEL